MRLVSRLRHLGFTSIWSVPGLIACAALAACSEEPARQRSVPTQQQRPAAPIDLEGRWRVLSIDARPPASPTRSGRAASIVITGNSIGGTLGCNDFGGLGLLADGHFAIHSWGGTAIGCGGEVGAQERAISMLFFARPRMTRLGPNRIRFESKDHALELERAGPNDSPPVAAGPEELEGTSWRIVMMDGEEKSSDPVGRVLRFGGEGWQGMASCATLSGTWRRNGNRIIVGREIPSTEQLCPADLARIDGNFADLMRSNPRYLVGPNGELLIAGGGHALAGGRLE